MLDELLTHLNNFFTPHGGIHDGEYTITDGSIELPFLVDGQYFRITGSTLNDGVYQYPTHGLSDETFSGAVWAMAVPPAVIALSAEIEAWQTKYGDSVSGPMASESFGGYSYTKSTSSSWQDAFRSRLNKWRKI